MSNGIVWEDAEWDFIANGVRAAMLLYPDASTPEILRKAMDGLPQSRHRKLYGGNVAAIWKKVTTLMEQQEYEERVRNKAGKGVLSMKDAARMVGAIRSLPGDQNRIATVEDISKMLDERFDSQRMMILQQEKRMISMLDDMYQSLMKFWTGNSEFKDSLVEHQRTEVMDQIVAFQELGQAAAEVRTKIKHDPSMQEDPDHGPRKPKVMIFGAKEDQRDFLQRELPDVQILVTKDIKKVTGSYALIIALKSFIREGDESSLNKHYPGRWISVNGLKTGVINAIKNHLAIA